nr:DUF418 domain-containing protein [Geomicrobium sp. JCM 19039]
MASNTATRYLVPDVGRGFMLLLIAIAHAPLSIAFTSEPRPETDGFVRLLTLLFVDSRAFVMFSVLFGFGLALTVRRYRNKGLSESTIKKMLKRRSSFLLLFGFIHLVFIGGMDILAFYGLTGLLIIPILFHATRKKKAMIYAGVVTLIVMPLIWFFSGTSILFADDGLPNTYLEMVITGLFSFPFVVLFQLLLYPFVLVILIGAWVESKGWIQQPDKYARSFTPFAIAAVLFSIVGALPYALAETSIITVSDTLFISFFILHMFVGILGGLGYIVLVALIMLKLQKSSITAHFASLGKRSLSFFIYQEGMLVLLLSNVGFVLVLNLDIPAHLSLHYLSGSAA